MQPLIGMVQNGGWNGILGMELRHGKIERKLNINVPSAEKSSCLTGRQSRSFALYRVEKKPDGGNFVRKLNVLVAESDLMPISTPSRKLVAPNALKQNERAIRF